MKLSKAIEIHAETIKYRHKAWQDDYYTALKLLIEAGKREKDYRTGYMKKWHPLLPGETED